MEVHRHTGHDLFFVSQSQSFLHHHIRKLAGEHIHFYRAFGSKTVTKYTWQHCVDSPNDRSEQARADAFPWKFPKEHYGLYKSSTIHTHKFKLPKKLAALIAFIFVVSGLTAYNAASSENSYLFSSSDKSSVDQPVESAPPKAAASVLGGVGSAATTSPIRPASTSIYDWADTEPVTPIAGCISSATKCQCFNESGAALKLSHAMCLSAIINPLPRSIIVGTGGGSKNGNAGQGLVQGTPQEPAAKQQPATVL